MDRKVREKNTKLWPTNSFKISQLGEKVEIRQKYQMSSEYEPNGQQIQRPKVMIVFIYFYINFIQCKDRLQDSITVNDYLLDSHFCDEIILFFNFNFNATAN
jgi:hypothetical protein